MKAKTISGLQRRTPQEGAGLLLDSKFKSLQGKYCQLVGDTAKMLGEYLRTGSPAGLRGRIQRDLERLTCLKVAVDSHTEAPETELYSVLSEQLILSQSQVVDFIKTQSPATSFPVIKSEVHDIFGGISNSLWRTLMQGTPDCEEEKKSKSQRGSQIKEPQDILRFSPKSFNTEQLKSGNSDIPLAERSTKTSKDKFMAFTSHTRKRGNSDASNLIAYKSAKFTQYKPVRKGRRSISPDDKKLHLLLKKTEKLRAKLRAVEQDRDLLRAWKANFSINPPVPSTKVLTELNIDKQQIQRSLAISQNKLKHLVNAAKHFIRCTSKLNKAPDTQYEDEKFRFELKVKEVLKEEARWNREPFRTPQESPVKGTKHDCKRATEELSNKLKKLRAELREKALKLFTLEKQLLRNSQEKGRALLDCKRDQGRVRQLEALLAENTQDLKDSTLKNAQKIEQLTVERDFHIEKHATLAADYKKLLTLNQGPSTTQEFIERATSELDSKYQSLLMRLARKEGDLKRLKSRVKEMLEHNLKTMIDLNADLASRGQSEELNVLHEEKRHLEFMLAQNQSWAQEKFYEADEQIETLLLEKQEFAGSLAILAEENKKLQRLLAATNSFQDRILELEAALEDANSANNLYVDELKDIRRKEFQSQGISIERHALEQENKLLCTEIQENREMHLTQQKTAQEELGKANQQIEALVFERNSLSTKHQQSQEELKKLLGDSQGLQATMQTHIKAKEAEITALQEAASKDEKYNTLLEIHTETQDLHQLCALDNEMYKRKLADYEHNNKHRRTIQEVEELLGDSFNGNLISSLVQLLKTHRMEDSDCGPPPSEPTERYSELLKDVFSKFCAELPELSEELERGLKLTQDFLGFSAAEIQGICSKREKGRVQFWGLTR